MAQRPFRESEVFLLHQLVIHLDRLARVRILDPAGVTYPEFLVLLTVRELGGPTQDEAAASLDMSKSLVSQRVSALIKKGLIVQTPRADNRRQVSLGLTEVGAALIEGLYGALSGSSDRLFSLLGPGREGFHSALTLLSATLENEPGTRT